MSIALPELHDATLDEPTVRQLFSDIAQCTRFIAALPRFARGVMTPQSTVSLDAACGMLLSHQAMGVQLRYHHEGSEWWDTLTRLAGDRFRLIRIRHDA